MKAPGHPTVRLISDVRACMASLIPGAARRIARAGIHPATMNHYGAVCVTAENGEQLGVFPAEMVWVSGKPARWGSPLTEDSRAPVFCCWTGPKRDGTTATCPICHSERPA